ncbi:hypothetical protein OT109_03370 [Phycisphaeraceae bacterium D3-23]
MDPAQATSDSADPPRKRPSRGWYVLAFLLLLVSGGVFVAAVLDGRSRAWAQIESMQRFVGPTDAGGVVLDLAEPGEYVVYYENLGDFEGASFDTPRHQVWTTPTMPAMTCRVAPADGGDALHVRLLGQTGDIADEFDQDRDTAVIYGRSDGTGRQGTGVWTMVVPEPGRYRIDVAYVESVMLDPVSIEVPVPLTRDEQSQTDFADAERHEADRQTAEARRALASLEPVDVLFAIGRDPTEGGFFQVLGLRGAASILAFGFTIATLMALVTLMLRTGQVTERGTMENVQRKIGRR